jgi:predicted anti-sigma-YlaC factor YlaD
MFPAAISVGRFSSLARRCVFAAVVTTLLAGCSIKQYAVGALGDALADGGDTYAEDDDVELIGLATPFGLKTIESLLTTVPDHRGLLLAAARGFTQYAYVFIQVPADELEEQSVAGAYEQRARARRMYLRARDYGLRGMGLPPPAGRERLRADPAGALAGTTASDVPLLYWTALSWAAAISLSKDDPATIAGLPIVDALVMRAAALDADWDHGTLRSFLIGYEINRPNAAPDAIERARVHFSRAVALSEGQQAAPYVSLAESVAVARRDRAEYVAMLEQAIAIDPGKRPEWRLANLVMQRRARWLLARVEFVFVE